MAIKYMPEPFRSVTTPVGELSHAPEGLDSGITLFQSLGQQGKFFCGGIFSILPRVFRSLRKLPTSALAIG